jgi:hypothetical protein
MNEISENPMQGDRKSFFSWPPHEDTEKTVDYEPGREKVLISH